MSKTIRKGNCVRRVDDGRRGIVVDVWPWPTGDSPKHRVRLLDGSYSDLFRKGLALAKEDPELAELRDLLEVEEVMES